MPIPDCPGFEASSGGDIRKSHDGKIKKQRRASNGSMLVDIGKSTRLVHDLVARAFHGGPPRGYRVKHANGDLSDNREENLSWFGAPAPQWDQPQTIPLDVEREYERLRLERLDTISLMQPYD